MPVQRIVGSVNTIPVKQVRARVRQVGVPNLVRVFRKHYACLLVAPGAVEKAELDLFGMRGKECKVDALTVPGRPQRVRAAGPHLPPRSHRSTESEDQSAQRR